MEINWSHHQVKGSHLIYSYFPKQNCSVHLKITPNKWTLCPIYHQPVLTSRYLQYFMKDLLKFFLLTKIQAENPALYKKLIFFCPSLSLLTYKFFDKSIFCFSRFEFSNLTFKKNKGTFDVFAVYKTDLQNQLCSFTFTFDSTGIIGCTDRFIVCISNEERAFLRSFHLSEDIINQSTFSSFLEKELSFKLFLHSIQELKKEFSSLQKNSIASIKIIQTNKLRKDWIEFKLRLNRSFLTYKLLFFKGQLEEKSIIQIQGINNTAAFVSSSLNREVVKEMEKYILKNSRYRVGFLFN